ncbi:MAG: hypothetical protein P0Y53_02540 [Candidatus Pseudobacter hemicellulosilyticus]|uniref:Uncharacterized protein n=1 Tax=Candidatus Pseudobacter hemicellulosilyticus TaxID=3121375 RepID=A0AAJ6BHK2_9BACT|nr:MAG: hypothetical protein P0Y53_02540 [Pseudobacter sp.]
MLLKGPLAFQRILRNTEFPEKLLPSAYPVDNIPDADLLAIRRQHREKQREEKLRQGKSAFLEMAQNAPGDLYDQLLRKKSLVDFSTIVPRPLDIYSQYVTHLLSGPGPIFTQKEPVGVGEMWWGETSFVLPNRLGMHGIFTDTGLLMLGDLSWDDGDLYQTAFHVYSSFYLGPDRMPSANQVRSSPGGVLLGRLFGLTGGAASFFLGGFAQGDQWSKCFLKLHQRAYAINPNNPADIIPAAPPAIAESRLFDISSSHDFAEGILPGGLAYPPVNIHLIKERILRIDLEIEIFIMLEGEAYIRFGGIGNADPAFHQWSQWTLQPF